MIHICSYCVGFFFLVSVQKLLERIFISRSKGRNITELKFQCLVDDPVTEDGSLIKHLKETQCKLQILLKSNVKITKEPNH